ncbi:hypothetical protein LXL04_008118 [Taraxacum kok-saghyz]
MPAKGCVACEDIASEGPAHEGGEEAIVACVASTGASNKVVLSGKFEISGKVVTGKRKKSGEVPTCEDRREDKRGGGAGDGGRQQAVEGAAHQMNQCVVAGEEESGGGISVTAVTSPLACGGSHVEVIVTKEVTYDDKKAIAPVKTRILIVKMNHPQGLKTSIWSDIRPRTESDIRPRTESDIRTRTKHLGPTSDHGPSPRSQAKTQSAIFLGGPSPRQNVGPSPGSESVGRYQTHRPRTESVVRVWVFGLTSLQTAPKCQIKLLG